MITTAFIISAFIAGILMFLAPCTLPLLPAYLAFISGVDPEEIKKGGEASKAARRKMFKNGILFILGFSVVFILFGVLAGLFGQTLVAYRIWLARIGGAFVILFGLFMLGIFKLSFLERERKFALPEKFRNKFTIGSPVSSFAVGGTFALGWTPCVGPILGSILLLASSSATAFSGAVMLAVFSLGLAVPFMLVTLLFSQATKLIEKTTKYLKIVSVIGGVFLVGIGILLVTDNFELTVQYGYQIFDFFNYDALLDYL